MYPKSFPADGKDYGAGLCAVRVIEPVTPFERSLAAMQQAGASIWRLTLWFDGRVFLTSLPGFQDVPPSLAFAMRHQTIAPLSWAEILRTQKAS